MQVLVKSGDKYSIHIDVKTADKNTTRISISNLVNIEALKVILHISVNKPCARHT